MLLLSHLSGSCRSRSIKLSKPLEGGELESEDSKLWQRAEGQIFGWSSVTSPISLKCCKPRPKSQKEASSSCLLCRSFCFSLSLSLSHALSRRCFSWRYIRIERDIKPVLLTGIGDEWLISRTHRWMHTLTSFCLFWLTSFPDLLQCLAPFSPGLYLSRMHITTFPVIFTTWCRGRIDWEPWQMVGEYALSRRTLIFGAFWTAFRQHCISVCLSQRFVLIMCLGYFHSLQEK